jgi:hypothetical protein
VRSRAPLIAVVLTLLLAVAVVLIFGRTMFSSVAAVSQDELEDKVAGLYASSNGGAAPDVSCDGELDSEVDATQDCEVQVGSDVARVHVVVTKVDGNDVRFEATPYLPADVVADSVRSELASKDVTVDTISCDGELVGLEGSTTTCTYAPPLRSGNLEVTVSHVDGLLINFRFKES